MSRSSPLDFPQTDNISFLEVPVPVFELPQCSVRAPCMEYIADCRTSQTRDVRDGDVETGTDLCGIRTY
jgi:hypothetical protein